MIYLHYKDTKTFGHSFSFLLIFKTLRASYLQVGNFSNKAYPERIPNNKKKKKGVSKVADCRLLLLIHPYFLHKIAFTCA